jgi:hypothetical protein
MKKADSRAGPKPSQLITNQIVELDDWRGKMLSRLRKMILGADSDIIEEWKWNTAVWTRAGLVCSGGAFKAHVKLNFFNGASLKDPKGMFTLASMLRRPEPSISVKVTMLMRRP